MPESSEKAITYLLSFPRLSGFKPMEKEMEKLGIIRVFCMVILIKAFPMSKKLSIGKLVVKS